MNSRQLIRELKQAGWVEIREKSSPHQFRHPEYSHVVTVPHPKKDLGKGLIKAIRQQGNLE